jgi:hypothetical protein
MECDSWDSLLARTFASPCLNCEPNFKVMTETLPFTKIHEVDDQDQWTQHINEIATKNPPKLFQGNHCVSSNQTKTNTTRKSVFIIIGKNLKTSKK